MAFITVGLDENKVYNKYEHIGPGFLHYAKKLEIAEGSKTFGLHEGMCFDL